jgi:tetratricopeptide (TPR) repeat protein
MPVKQYCRGFAQYSVCEKVNIMVSRLSALVFVSVMLGAVAFAQPADSKVSPDEMKAAQAIMAAPDPGKKLKAGEDFIKKFPKSTIRPRVARGLVDQISAVTDAGQKVALAQEFQQAFNEPSEQDAIVPVIVEGLSQAKRSDEVFTTGTAYLSKNPDALLVLIQLLATGAEEAKNKNTKFVTQSLQYGKHVVELIDAGKKPADVDDAAWTKYKTDTMPSIYQSLGLLNLVSGDRAQAVANYSKAAELAPNDVFNVLMLGQLTNADYQDSAKRFQAMPSGATKDEELKKTQVLLDKVIEAYARAVAVSEGDTRYGQVREQFLQDLESYYKYRHNGSNAGMQELINKYKPAPKP